MPDDSLVLSIFIIVTTACRISQAHIEVKAFNAKAECGQSRVHSDLLKCLGAVHSDGPKNPRPYQTVLKLLGEACLLHCIIMIFHYYIKYNFYIYL